MNTKTNKIEMKDDGKDAERFASALKTVVNVSKEEVKKHEDRVKTEKGKRAKA